MIRWKSCISGFAVLVAFSAQVMAFSLGDIKAGSWAGTIGAASVNVCFKDGGSGVYYYKKYFKPIGLFPRENSPELVEVFQDGPSTASWTVDVVSQDELRGSLSVKKSEEDDSEKSTTANTPINIRRVSNSCEDSYFKGVLDSIQLKAKKYSLNGLNLVSSVVEKMGAEAMSQPKSKFKYKFFKLDAVGAGAAKFNAEVDVWLAKEAKSWFECRAESAEGYGETSMVALAYLSPLLVIKDQDESYCGGSRPNSYTSYENYDLQEGVYVEMWSLIKSKIMRPDCKLGYKSCLSLSLPDKALEAVLKAKFAAAGVRCSSDSNEVSESDGQDIRDDPDGYDIRVDKRGLIFKSVFPHVMQACEREALIEFPRVLKFLNSEGVKYLTPIWEANR